ncbi:Flagellum-associated coiled-coil domain-containing protein 1 [Varanus komodoensis]|nr:Flagellum-associated coiled-coil domain-containing protein 1 [Varanus komodoensis]
MQIMVFDHTNFKNMSQSNFLYCPCWDPWKIGCKRLVKAKAGQLNQKHRVILPARTYIQPLRSRKPRDISKEFEEEVIPGFTVVRSKEHIDVTLGEEFFERKKPSKESAKPTVPREDVITDLVEQIAELTAMMEQLRRDHQATHKQLEKDMEEKCNEMQEEHEKKMSISDEMEEKWLRRQAEWKKSERTEREKALLQQKQSLTKKFELEIEEQKKIIQNNSFLIGKAYEQERESLEEELKEKNETLHAIASSLHKTELELLNEKTNLAEMEKNIQQRIAMLEEKHRINLATLVEENVLLRRKLIEKNEEIFNGQSRRSTIFEPNN